VRAVHAVVELAGSQVWHPLLGLIAPEARQTPEMTQPLHVIAHMPVPVSQVWPAGHVGVPVSQRSVPSLHVSLPLHPIPSSQVRDPPPRQTAPAEQLSVIVQYSPSSHGEPVGTGVQLVVEVSGRHAWHWLPGLIESGG